MSGRCRILVRATNGFGKARSATPSPLFLPVSYYGAVRLKQQLPLFLFPQLAENHFYSLNWLTRRILKSRVPDFLEPDALNQGNTNLFTIYHYSSLHRFASAQDRQVIRRFRPDVLIHASDEKLRHRSSNYRFAKVVIREYFNPNLLRKAFFIPVGYNEEIIKHLSQLVNGNARNLSWSFFGNIKGDRVQMLEAFASIQPNRASTSSSGMLRNLPLSDEEVARLLVDSHFVLCPFGSLSPDTWRVMEALEAGAIPVCIEMRGIDYFKFIFGDHPFIVSGSWDEAAHEVGILMENPEALSAKHAEIVAWYRGFTHRMSQDLLAILFRHRAVLVSEQFKYQQRARWDMKVRAAFWMHFFRPRIVRRIWATLDKLRPDRA